MPIFLLVVLGIGVAIWASQREGQAAAAAEAPGASGDRIAKFLAKFDASKSLGIKPDNGGLVLAADDQQAYGLIKRFIELGSRSFTVQQGSHTETFVY